MSDRQAVRDALQRGYGDATQTVLDDRVAGEVMSTLRERGWCELREVALILAAAGGEVVVSREAEDQILGGRWLVEVSEDWESGGKRVRLVLKDTPDVTT